MPTVISWSSTPGRPTIGSIVLRRVRSSRVQRRTGMEATV